VCRCQKCKHLRLEVCWKPGVRLRFNIAASELWLVNIHSYRLVKLLDAHSHFLKLCCQRLHMRRYDICNGGVSAGCRSGDHERSRFDLIRDHAESSAVQRLNSSYPDNVSTRASD